MVIAGMDGRGGTGAGFLAGMLIPCRMYRAALTCVVTLLGVAPHVGYAQPIAGLRGGLSVTSVSSELLAEIDATTSFLPAVGLFLTAPVAPRFSVQPELVFNRKGNKFAGGSGPGFRLTYLQLPLLARYRIAGRAAGREVFVFAGPAVGFEIECSVEGIPCSQPWYPSNPPPVPPTHEGLFDTNTVVLDGVVGLGITMGLGRAVGGGNVSVLFDIRADVGLTSFSDASTNGFTARHRGVTAAGGMGFAFGGRH
jgi:hypothetical protein